MIKQSNRNIYTKSVIRLIRASAWDNLRKIVYKSHPSDLAEILEQLGLNHRRVFVPIVLKGGKLGSALLEIYESGCIEILESLDDKMIVQVIKEISSDDAADLLALLEKERIETVLSLIRDPSLTRQLRHLLSFSPSTAGGIMQAEYFAVPESETVAHTVQLIRQKHGEATIFYVYTLDSNNRLSGVVSFRQLLLAQDDVTLAEISIRQVAKVHVDEDQEAVAKLVYRYDLLAIPVVDSKNRIAGIITVDDVMEVMEQEASEDIFKLAGSDVEEMMYGDRIFKITRVRAPWLLISVVTGIITASIIAAFSETIEAIIALAAFIPVLTGMAGNVGTQSAAITVRGLAIGRVTAVDMWSTVFRESRVGLVLGILCGTLVGIISSVWDMNPFLGVVICCSMIIGITFAATSATLMPILFARMNVDPAVASGPLVTTLNDCVSVLIYLSFATGMLRFLQ